MLLAFGGVWTQYAIALELRLAYCGLQDANLDLQVKQTLQWVHTYLADALGFAAGAPFLC